MRIWMVSLGVFFILVPTYIFAEILWQDDFDDYYPGMPLEYSPYWDDGGSRVCIQQGSDLWVWGDGTSIASGGAYDPGMRVSVSEVEVNVAHTGCLDVITRLSDSTSQGYGARYVVSADNYEEGPIYYFIGIGIIEGSLNFIWLEWRILPLNHNINSISIVATGDDEVEISAWFGNYHLTYTDTEYKLNGGFGGFRSWGCL